jgi:2,4-dienoyl-CoA reductase (NADPH2)
VDHYGLAAHIQANFGAEILIPRKDAIKLQRHVERLTHMDRLLLECGFDESFIRNLRKTLTDNKFFPIIPEHYQVVEESDIPERLGISWLSCPGHSQSDLVYLFGDYAVTGDILLKNIFQAPLLDVDLETFSGRFRNYDAYCSSLLKMKALRGLKILPGHRKEVAGLDGTVLFYVRKLLERAGHVGRISASEPVRGVIGKLFGGAMTDPFLLYLKASEIVFMRDFLADPGRLKCALEQIGLFDQVSALYREVVEKLVSAENK